MQPKLVMSLRGRQVSQVNSEASMDDGPHVGFFGLESPSLNNSRLLLESFNQPQALDLAEILHPTPEIVLRHKRFVALVAISTAAIGGITALFWHGINLTTFLEPVGESDEAEWRVQLYNTYSGVVMGFAESLVGLGLASFFPVFIIYMHNLPWFPGDNPLYGTPKFKRIALMLFFPLVMIAVGSSMSALQANSSTQGQRLSLDASTLQQQNSRPTGSTTKPTVAGEVPLDETILATAVRRRVAPFRYVQSNCRKALAGASSTSGSARRGNSPVDTDTAPLQSVFALDSTSVRFGFPVKAWARSMGPASAIPEANNSVIDMKTAFELAFQGQALFERAIADSNTITGRECTGRNHTAKCAGGNTALSYLMGFVNGSKSRDEQNLRAAMADALGLMLEDVNTTAMTIDYQTMPLNSMMNLQAMMIQIPDNIGVPYGLNGSNVAVPEGCKRGGPGVCDQVYRFDHKDAFCGSKSCIFLDWHSTRRPRKQVAVMQYAKNCPASKIKYDGGLYTYVPSDCETEENAAFLFGLGSGIIGDEFGINFNGTGTPFVRNPRRVHSLAFAKLSWKFEDVSKTLNASCLAEDCSGLVHQLRQDQRFLVLGKQSLPASLSKATFKNPTRLIELISPQIKCPRYSNNSAATIERLVPANFKTFSWTTAGLSGDDCSVLADSYLRQITANQYYLTQPLQPMYTSALMYMFQNASISKTRKQADNNDASEAVQLSLAGDKRTSEVFLRNTTVGSVTTWLASGIMFVLAALVLLLPNERARLKPTVGKNARAERFIGIQTDETYPNFVYKKRFLIGHTGEEIKLSEFTVQSVGLHHKMDEDELVYL
ncbi:TPA: hypothetical protein N0F65_010826 [Lagenidium giganteum]|uniref:Uncharacterized protein n=1 Tax=Lagenidium giganteum TaxID=4803 RepID=A0AAV2Z6Q0_9STRA|nr:TPA: hypothetical protein N0F65_010826 [Lagenidium giganteum]